jgi:hypothetical protein
MTRIATVALSAGNKATTNMGCRFLVIEAVAAQRMDITDAVAERAAVAHKPRGGGLGIAAIDIH